MVYSCLVKRPGVALVMEYTDAQVPECKIGPQHLSKYETRVSALMESIEQTGLPAVGDERHGQPPNEKATLPARVKNRSTASPRMS